MSHAGNWGPAKRARMGHALSAAEAAERERAMILTPAMTRGFGWREGEIGCGCPLHRPVPDRCLKVPEALLTEPWVCIMRRHLRCTTCGERPHFLSFHAWQSQMWACQTRIDLQG